MNQEYDPAESRQREIEDEYERSMEDANNEFEWPKSTISLDEAMIGFTGGNLELLRGMKSFDVWGHFRSLSGPDDPRPSFTLDDLTRWMNERGY